MTVHDSALVAWGFQPMTEGHDHQRRVRFGNTNSRQLGNLLNLSPENARFGRVGFPHLTRRLPRSVPYHGLEGRATKMQWRGITHGCLNHPTISPT
jgi:hypothetical protein